VQDGVINNEPLASNAAFGVSQKNSSVRLRTFCDKAPRIYKSKIMRRRSPFTAGDGWAARLIESGKRVRGKGER
jgi:hypothetical protein